MSLKLPRYVVGIHPHAIKSGSGLPEETASQKSIAAPQPGAVHFLPEEIQEREEKAYQFGFEDGKKLAMQEIQDKLASTIKTLENGLKAFQQAESAMYRDNEPVIFDLALGIASRILKKEIELDPELIRNIAADAVRLVEDKHRLLIRANPENLHVLQSYANESLVGLQGVDQVEILEDIRVEPGGCVVESQSGIVDAQIKTQLSEIYDHLMDSITRKQVA